MKKKFLMTILSASLALGGMVHMAQAQDKTPVKVGLMLPYSGTYSALTEMIERGFKLYVQEQGGELAGHPMEYFKVDDESDPAKAADNVNKLIKRDKVDLILGTVHSGVAMAMAKAAKESGTLMIVPNAGAVNITGPLCAMNILRTSFNNWQPGYGIGIYAGEKGWKKAVTVTWNYAAGNEMAKGFEDGFAETGGKVSKALRLPFPNVEFQSILTDIASQKPDVVFAFFAGGGAVKFVKDYAAAGLTMPLVGTGFLTDGTLEAQGDSANGVLTGLHYADDLDTETDNAFRKAFEAEYGVAPDVYAVQGYDAAQVFAAGLKAVDGDVSKKDEMEKAMREAVIDSPRGKLTFSPSGDPVQDIYVREVGDGENKVVSVAVEQLVPPVNGCRLQ